MAKTKKTEEKEQKLSLEAEKEASEKEVPKKKGKPSKVSSGSISMISRRDWKIQSTSSRA